MAVAGKQSLPTSTPCPSPALQTRLLHSSYPAGGSGPGSSARNHKESAPGPRPSISQHRKSFAGFRQSQVRTSPLCPARDGVSWDIPSNPNAKGSSTPGPAVPAPVTLEGHTRTGVQPSEPGAGRDLPDSSRPSSMAPLFPACLSSPFPSQTALQLLPACKKITCDLSHNQCFCWLFYFGHRNTLYCSPTLKYRGSKSACLGLSVFLAS